MTAPDPRLGWAWAATAAAQLAIDGRWPEEAGAHFDRIGPLDRLSFALDEADAGPVRVAVNAFAGSVARDPHGAGRALRNFVLGWLRDA